ncbi:MAG: hypothetical protein CML66_24125 [Rhodobacteraceae bacterium]|nr:hypothetical protein [Paracoccaceae bacterium]QEW22716.1 hypothetical protein LA6_004950 [Marinibacterium anthonyi]
MKRNIAAVRLRRRAVDPMREHDRLPPRLRLWATQAALPWSARSIRRVWVRALAETGGDEARAIACLDRAEARRLARETLYRGLF